MTGVITYPESRCFSARGTIIRALSDLCSAIRNTYQVTAECQSEELKYRGRGRKTRVRLQASTFFPMSRCFLGAARLYSLAFSSSWRVAIPTPRFLGAEIKTSRSRRREFSVTSLGVTRRICQYRGLSRFSAPLIERIPSRIHGRPRNRADRTSKSIPEAQFLHFTCPTPAKRLTDARRRVIESARFGCEIRRTARHRRASSSATIRVT